MKLATLVARTAPLAALVTLALAIAPPQTAHASEMVFTGFPASVTTEANGDFCYQVTVKNVGRKPGAVRIVVKGSPGISGLTCQPSPVQLDPGEDWTFKICGHLEGQQGTVTMQLVYVGDNELSDTDWKRRIERVFIHR
jgi:hypothetical protein